MVVSVKDTVWRMCGEEAYGPNFSKRDLLGWG
jgi:hypothetical protein